jgi:hypothetical protein
MLRFDNFSFKYEPYPLGISPEFIEPAFFQELAQTFPGIELFKFHESQGRKYALSENSNAEIFYQFLKSSPPWRKLVDIIASEKFIMGCLELLKRNGIDLGYLELGESTKKYTKIPLEGTLEFSALPIRGGAVLPHTDAPKKIVSLVLSMNLPGELPPNVGGGTEVSKCRVPEKSYNYLNKQIDFSESEPVYEVNYQPNNCLLFVKTYNSLHCVRPMTGDRDDVFRKSLTINVKTVDAYRYSVGKSGFFGFGKR